MAYAIFVLSGNTRTGPAQGWLAVGDVEAHEGRGWAEMSADVAKALRWDTFGAAMEFWRQRSKARPTRPDGKPNRPLTAFTVEIVNLDRGSEIVTRFMAGDGIAPSYPEGRRH